MRARVSQVSRMLVGWILTRVAASASTEPLAVVRMPEELLASRIDTEVTDLLRRLRTDRGCTGPGPRRHLACRAARELGDRGLCTRPVLAAFEDTVAVSTRPDCVRRAAVESLCSMQPHGRPSLARMHATMRRRLEFEGDGRLLVARMDEALRNGNGLRSLSRGEPHRRDLSRDRLDAP